jgi:biopolymer transport protein ExbD
MNKKYNRKSLLIARKHSAAVMKPQLTSLIDVMTILLVFLLKSFSTDGNLISVSRDIDLAESSSKKAPEPALNIEITGEQVNVDGYAVVSLEKVAETDSMLIGELREKLVEAAGSVRMAGNRGRIIIQCDRAVDFKVLKKIMYTCGKSDLSHFSLLVQEKV